MEEIHIYLKSEKAEKKLIYLYFNYYSVNRLKVSISDKIEPSQWDDKRELPRKSYRHYHSLKTRIELFKAATEDLWKEYKAKAYIPTVDEFKLAVKDRVNNQGSKEMTLVAYMEEFISSRRLSTTYTKGTIGTYTPILKDIRNFDPHIRISQVNAFWMNKLRDHLYRKGLEQNTVHNKLATIQTMLTQAAETGIQVAIDFKTKRTKVSRIETTQIYLNEQEIEMYYHAQVPPDLEAAKDIFVLMCYTGPRISDTWKIGRSSFFREGDTEYFSFHMKKTRQVVNIPIHPFVREILDKYGWELPEVDMRLLRGQIKEVGRIAGLTQEIDLVKYPSGVMSITKVPRYSQIKTHTGRRSMACNMLIAGVPEAVVMAVGGWRTHKSFLPYIRLTASDKLKIASKSAFFTGARVMNLAG